MAVQPLQTSCGPHQFLSRRIWLCCMPARGWWCLPWCDAQMYARRQLWLITWLNIPPLCFTWLLLDAVVRLGTKSASIHIWERHSWVIMPSINAITWPLLNGLSGWRIVIHSSSSSLMTGKTLQSCASKWDSCTGRWSLNTGMTCAWPMQIISHVLAQISALILSWKNTSSRSMLSAVIAQPQWGYLLHPWINRTSADHVWICLASWNNIHQHPNKVH